MVQPGGEIIKEKLRDIDGNEGVVSVDESCLRQLGKMLQRYYCFMQFQWRKGILYKDEE